MTNNFKPNKGGYQKPQLSPEEWKAKKQAEKDAVYQLIDKTATAIVQDGEKFRGFLDTQARLDRYSAANALLIYSQYPKATQLKDFGDWAEEKVSINKGAKSISILEPVEYTKADGTPGISYNVKKVFDVSQTKGRQTPAPTVNRDPQALVAVMIDTSPVIVEVAPELPHPQMGAFYDNEKQTLFVKKDIGDSVALCQCVAQELGQRLLQPQGYGLSGNVRRLYALQKVRRGHQKLCYQPYPGGMEEQRAEGNPCGAFQNPHGYERNPFPCIRGAVPPKAGTLQRP